MWDRCAAGERCPPVFLLTGLGPKPYGKGDSLRSFEEYETAARQLVGGDDVSGDVYVWPWLVARRPVLTGACGQFEGYVGFNPPPAAARNGSTNAPVSSVCSLAGSRQEAWRAP